MKLLSAVFLSLAFLSSLAASAEDCSTVDVRDSMTPASKERFSTPYSQGEIGWCFGYVAADMLSQATGDSISALHTSAYYDSTLNGIERWGREIFSAKSVVDDGGEIDGAISEIQHLGHYCPESSIHSVGLMTIQLPFGSGSYPLSNVGTKEFLQSLDKYRQGQCDAQCTVLLDSLLTAYVPTTSPQALKDYVLAHKDQPMDKLLFAMLDNSCNAKKNFPKEYSVVSFSQGSTRTKRDEYSRDLSDHIDDALDAGSVVGLSYHARYITPMTSAIFADSHASTIIGRQKINNVCHYLVRNSWGATCDYRDGVICVKDQGAYWVTRQIMNVMADEIFVISK